MKEMPIGDVNVGAVLAVDLKNAGGSMILGQGATLTASVLARLQKMGIETLSVEIDDPEELRKEQDVLEASIRQRFSGSEENEYLQELMRLAILHVRAA